jgi:hypothetical protein
MSKLPLTVIGRRRLPEEIARVGLTRLKEGRRRRVSAQTGPWASSAMHLTGQAAAPAAVRASLQAHRLRGYSEVERTAGANGSSASALLLRPRPRSLSGRHAQRTSVWCGWPRQTADVDQRADSLAVSEKDSGKMVSISKLLAKVASLRDRQSRSMPASGRASSRQNAILRLALDDV